LRSTGSVAAGATTVLQPSEVLYKKPVLVERGSFRPVTHVNVDMLECALRRFAHEPGVAGEPVVPLMEITMRNLMATTSSGDVDVHDFLARADVLAACGMSVLISDYFEYYRLAAYLSRNNAKRKIAVTMGAASLRDLFDEKYYAALEGGILESFGRLFKNDLTTQLEWAVRHFRRLISGGIRSSDSSGFGQVHMTTALAGLPTI
jgi:hypothetical protein